MYPCQNSSNWILKIFVFCVCVLVTQSCLTLCDPMNCSPQASSVHGILQARKWSGLSFPSPGDLPDPGIEPGSPALQAASLPSEPPGKPKLKPSRGKRPVQSHMSFTNPDHMFSKVALVSQKDMGPKQDYEA